MRLAITFLNEHIELFEGVYGQQRNQQLAALPRLYNHLLGPVTALSLHRPDLLDLSMYSGSCSHSPIGSLMRDLTVRTGAADGRSIPGGGKGEGMLQPVLGALGELAERLLAVLHFQAALDGLEWATHEELVRRNCRALDPEELPLFAPEQYARPGFEFLPFRPDTRLRWIEGHDMLTGEPVLVPAQLVLPYYKRPAAEPPIGYPTSGGLAFHTDRRGAILHGLYEVIERDAVNVRWFCRLPPQRVDLDLPDFVAGCWGMRHARLSTAFIEEVQVFLNTLDVPIPVFTMVAVDKSRRERAFLGGGGAWSSRERALRQALFEIGQTRAVLRSYRPTGMKRIRPDSSTSEMTDFLDATVFFGYQENLPRLSWYTAGEQVVPWEDVPHLASAEEATEHAAVARWLRAAGLRPIVLDFGGACWPGVFVTKVLVPQLTAACVPAHPYLGHPRYYELPERLGMADRPLDLHQLNLDPIPFP